MYLSRLLLAIFFVGLLGMTLELLLLEHFEDVLQFVPLVLLGAGFAVGSWYAKRPSEMSLRAFRGLLLLFAIGGLVGLFLHFRGNIEFEKETYPELSSVRLVWQSLTGATPTLAPGAMILLAMIGYAATVARGGGTLAPSRS